ncbi:MAG TPA: hypothetical protein VF783_09005 [Terriglobales bacterium]
MIDLEGAHRRRCAKRTFTGPARTESEAISLENLTRLLHTVNHQDILEKFTLPLHKGMLDQHDTNDRP